MYNLPQNHCDYNKEVGI